MTDTPARTLSALLERNAREAGNSPALLSPTGARIGHRGLLDDARCLSRALIDAGAAPGDTVALSLPEGLGLARGLLGTMRAHAAAPLGLSLPRREVDALLAGLAPAAVLVAPGRPGALRDAARELGLPLVELPEAGRREAADGLPEPAPESPALVLHTSGTTGRPKRVPLTHGNLAHASRWVARSLALTPADRCLNLMPLIHSHGIVGALLGSLAAGSSVVCAEWLDPRELLRWAQDSGATWTTGSPTVLRLVLEARGTWPGLRFLRSASAPMPPELAEALEVRFRAPQIQVYGMTEAYQIAANPLPPGRRRHGSVGLPTGCEVAIRRADGSLAGPEEPGEILVRGANVFGGYAGERGQPVESPFEGGWLGTGDGGRIDEDGYLHVTGRLEERIARGGEKIAPLEVERVLETHADVAAALCFPVPDERLGEEVGAIVVPRDGATLDAPELRRFVSTRLAPTKVPRHFWARASLPEPEHGKIRRRGVHEALGLELPEAGASEAGADGSLVREMQRLWQQQLGLPALPDTNARFFDLGGTSLGLVDLMIAIERRFGARLPLSSILDAPSVAELAAKIREDRPVEAPREIVVRRSSFNARLLPIQPRGTRAPLLFVGPAGGSVLPYLALADRLPRDRPFWGLQIDVTKRRLRLDLDVREIAAAFVEGVERLAPGQPSVLGGWSFGALVAWEMTAGLRSLGLPVERLVVLDSSVARFAPGAEEERLRDLVVNVASLVRHSAPLVRDALYARWGAARRGEIGRGPVPLRERIARRLGRKSEVARVFERAPHLAGMRTDGLAIVGTLRHFVRAARRYTPSPQPVPIDVLRAESARRRQSETLGWEHLGERVVRGHPIPGNHFTILSPAHLPDLARTLEKVLAEPP